MSNSDSTKSWEHEPGAQVGWAPSVFLETPAELLIKNVKSMVDEERGNENYDTNNKSIFMAQMDTP